MSCDRTGWAELSGYADGELPAEVRQRWDEHLRECAACRIQLAEIRASSATLRRNLPPREPSSAFRGELQQVIRAEPSGATRGRAPTRWRGWELGLAATVLFAIGLGIGRVTDGGGNGDNAVIAQVVAGHVRSLEVDHLVDIVSSEHHVVKPWFAGKLDFSPPVPDLVADSFPLIGGRVDYAGGRAVAALVYGRGPHRINLLLWPDAKVSGCDREALLVRQGFNLVHGRGGGMEFWAISDLNRQELEAFVGVWQRGASPGEEGCEPRAASPS